MYVFACFIFNSLYEHAVLLAMSWLVAGKPENTSEWSLAWLPEPRRPEPRQLEPQQPEPRQPESQQPEPSSRRLILSLRELEASLSF